MRPRYESDSATMLGLVLLMSALVLMAIAAAIVLLCVLT